MLFKHQSACSALSAAVALFVSASALAQVRVSLAEERASVVFPVGVPRLSEVSERQAAILRTLEERGSSIDHTAEVYEAQAGGESFLLTATSFEGSGVPLPTAKCLKAPPARMLELVEQWSCREVSTSGVAGLEVGYVTREGVAFGMLSFPHAGRVFALTHLRNAAAPGPDHREAFFRSFRLKVP